MVNKINGTNTTIDLYKSNNDKILLDPSENRINKKPNKKIKILNLKKLSWFFEFITKQPATNADKNI